MRSRWMVSWLAVTWMLGTGVVAESQTTPRVHTLVLVTQRSDLVQGARVSANDLLELVNNASSNSPGKFMRPRTVGLPEDRETLSAKSIEDAVKNTFSSANDFQPDDTIFCYVFSHGGHTTSTRPPVHQLEDYEYGHFLETDRNRAMANGQNHNRFARCDLFELLLDMRQKAANSPDPTHRLRGLTVLISDSCNNRVEALQNAELAGGIDKTNTALFEKLLTGYRGQVSLNSSASDELAWYNPIEGARFTTALLKHATMQPETTNWEEVVRFAKKELKDRFPNRTQTPMWMRKPERVGPLK